MAIPADISQVRIRYEREQKTVFQKYREWNGVPEPTP